MTRTMRMTDQDEVIHIRTALDCVAEEVGADGDLAPCGPAAVSQLRHCLFLIRSHLSPASSARSGTFVHSRALSTILSRTKALTRLCDDKFLAFPYRDVPTCWRRLCTDSVLLRVAGALGLAPSLDVEERPILEVQVEDGESGDSSTSALEVDEGRPAVKTSGFWMELIRAMDMALIVAGAPGPGRRELVLNLIEATQRRLARTVSAAAYSTIEKHPGHSENSESLTAAHRPSKRVKLDSGSARIDEDAPIKSIKSTKPVKPTPFPARAAGKVPELPSEPSLSAFLSTHRHAPFILRNFAADWPALQPASQEISDDGDTSGNGANARKARQARKAGRDEPRWACGDYLRKLTGQGRVVPVEVGGRYTDEGWGQAIESWDEFLRRSGWPSYTAGDGDSTNNGGAQHEAPTEALPPLYLAQHSLLHQFPALGSDIILPDYIYACPPAPESYSAYTPPRNEDGDEDVIVNVWMGPRGTDSPAHTDPYHNCYVQVVGYKQVWLAPPNANANGGMCAYGASTENVDADAGGGSDMEDREEEQGATAYMSNTSRVDVFSSSPLDSEPGKGKGAAWSAQDRQARARFEIDVQPNAMVATLGPGDLLFFPPGWWHAMRSLSRSFSVSMWF